jgi:signal transduction histidine kinase
MNWYLFSTALVPITNSFLGAFVLLQDRKNMVNRLFCLLSYSIALWSMGDLFSLLPLQLGEPFIIVAWRVSYFGAIFIPAVYINFIFSLIGISNKRVLLLIVYGLSGLLFLINLLTPLFIEGVALEPVLGASRLISVGGPFFSLFVLLFIWGLIYGSYVLLRGYGELSGVQRGQVQYVLLATTIALFAGSIYFLTIFNIKVPAIDNFIVLSYVLIVAYAITKHELMDIKLVITRAVAYGIVGTLLGLSFVVLDSVRMNISLNMAANALLALFWAFAANRLRRLIQTPLEEKWITDWFDSDKLINHIATKLIPAMDREGIFNIIAAELKAAIKIKDIKIVMGRQETDYKDLTPTKEGLVMPLSSTEELEGILVLGPKISEDPYNDKDLTVFRTIMVQAMAIFDRVRPYEQIKNEFDANEKKLLDTERLLARSEKIASMANLVQEYNHQVKTPLSIIRGRIETLFDKTRDEEYLKSVQALLLEQIDRANYIVESTLRLSRPHERQETELDMTKLIEESLHLFPPSGVSVVKELKPGLTIKGDREDLETVFINLFKNAVEAMPRGGELKITTYTGEENGSPLACAAVTDTGVGIPPENLEKIFEPFFSTSVTKGRGLGLSIVFRIVREHLGSIDIESQVGKGTKFILKFPAKS